MPSTLVCELIYGMMAVETGECWLLITKRESQSTLIAIKFDNGHRSKHVPMLVGTKVHGG